MTAILAGRDIWCVGSGGDGVVVTVMMWWNKKETRGSVFDCRGQGELTDSKLD